MTSNPALSAIVLCGGRSARMGKDKANVQLDGQALLQHTCDSIGQITDNIVVVAAPDQTLPRLTAKVVVVRDLSPFPGPLPAMLSGFQRLQMTADGRDPESCVWMSGCDTPFITAEIISNLHRQLIQSPADVVTLTEGNRRNPLLAVYRLRVASKLQQAIESDVRRATQFLNSLDVLEYPVDGLATHGGTTHGSLPSKDARVSPTTNLNTPEDLDAARRIL